MFTMIKPNNEIEKVPDDGTPMLDCFFTNFKLRSWNLELDTIARRSSLCLYIEEVFKKLWYSQTVFLEDIIGAFYKRTKTEASSMFEELFDHLPFAHADVWLVWLLHEWGLEYPNLLRNNCPRPLYRRSPPE